MLAMPGTLRHSAPLLHTQQQQHQQQPCGSEFQPNGHTRKRRRLLQEQPHQQSPCLQGPPSYHQDTLSEEKGTRNTARELPSPESSRELVDSHESLPTKRCKISSGNEQDPIQYWALQGSWPPDYCNMSDNARASPKRPRTPSYASSVRSGSAPPAHSAASVSHLAAHGVVLDPMQGRRLISADNKDFVDQLYHGSLHENVPNVLPCVGYPIDKLDLVLGKLSTRNEARIIRDLTALMIPSAENLAFSGMTELSHLAEDLNADWSRVATMGGPAPRPDLTVGLDASAFTDAESQKLKNFQNWENGTFFTSHVLFPFLICEVKSSDQTINKASRQAGHSGAMATQAIWKLYHSAERRDEVQAETPGTPDGQSGVFVGDQVDVQESEPQRAADQAANVSVEELNGKVLVFSIAHDNQTVQLYGHFPSFGDGDARPTIHRYLIDSQSLLLDGQALSQKIRNFVVKTYLTFSQAHLQRIQKALRAMPEPQTHLPDVHRPDQDAMSMPPPSASASQMRERQLEEQLARERAERAAEGARERLLEEQLARERAERAAEGARERERERAEREAERAASAAEKESMRAQISQLLQLVERIVPNDAA